MLTGFGDRSFVIYAAYALVFFGTTWVAWLLLQEQETRAAQENLADLRNRKATNALVKITRPFFTNYVVPIVRGKDFWDSQRRHYKRKIISGGLREELTADEFISFKLFLILFFPLILGFLKATDFIDLDWYYIPIAATIGWFYPDLWVRSRIQTRQKSILRSLPFIVDLLALSTEAGLDFVGAIGKVVEKANTSPLVEELDQLLKEIKVGSSRQDALREMANRIDMSQVTSFTAILISADQMGASIGKILRQQSDQVRVERMVRAEKAGIAAAQKVLIPLVLFIVPAVLLMVFGPYAVQLLSSGGAF